MPQVLLGGCSRADQHDSVDQAQNMSPQGQWSPSQWGYSRTKCHRKGAFFVLFFLLLCHNDSKFFSVGHQDVHQHTLELLDLSAWTENQIAGLLGSFRLADGPPALSQPGSLIKPFLFLSISYWPCLSGDPWLIHQYNMRRGRMDDSPGRRPSGEISGETIVVTTQKNVTGLDELAVETNRVEKIYWFRHLI